MAEHIGPEDVIAAAGTCFLTYGFKATTVEHVAAQAGTSRTTVMRLVGGRQKLIDAVLVHEAMALLEHLAPIVGEANDLDELIRTTVAGAIAAVEERPLLKRAAGPDIATLLLAATASAMPMISTLASGGRLLLGGMRERLGGPDVDPAVFDDLVEDLVRYILALLHTPTIDGRNRDPQAAGERAVHLFVPAFEAAARRSVAGR